jgi:hypothetical protein
MCMSVSDRQDTSKVPAPRLPLRQHLGLARVGVGHVLQHLDALRPHQGRVDVLPEQLSP